MSSSRPSIITTALHKIKPGFAEAHYELAVCLASHGRRTAPAVVQYEKALELKPDYAIAHCNLAVALGGLEDFDSAIVHFQKALAIRPDYSLARKNLAIAQSEREKLSKTLAERREVDPIATE